MAIGSNPTINSRAPDGKNVNVTRRRRRGSATCGISKRTTIMLVDYTRKQANLSPNSLSRLNTLIEGGDSFPRRRPPLEDSDWGDESKTNDDLHHSTEELASFEDSVSSAASNVKQQSTPAPYTAQRRASSNSIGNSQQSSLSSSEHSLGIEKVFEDKLSSSARAKQALYCISVSISEGGEKIKFSLRNPEVLKAVRQALAPPTATINNNNNNNNNMQDQPSKPKSISKREIKCVIPHDRFQLPQMQAIKPENANNNMNHNSQRRFSVVSGASTNSIRKLQCIAEGEESENTLLSNLIQKKKKHPSLMDSCDSFAIGSLADDSSAGHTTDEEEEQEQPASTDPGKNESDSEAEEEEEEEESKAEEEEEEEEPKATARSVEAPTVASTEEEEDEDNESESNTNTKHWHGNIRSSLHESSLFDSGSLQDGKPKFGTSMPSLMFLGGGEHGASESDVGASQVEDDDDEEEESESEVGFGASASGASLLLGEEESHTEYDDESQSQLGEGSHTTAYDEDQSQSQRYGYASETDREYDADTTEVEGWNEDATEVALVDDSHGGHGYRRARAAAEESESEEEYEEDLENEEDRDETEAGECESHVSADESHVSAEPSETDGSLVTTATDESSQAGLNYGLSQYLSSHSRVGGSGLIKSKMASCNDSQTATSITASTTTGFQSMDASGQSSVLTGRTGGSSSRSLRSNMTHLTQRTSRSAPTVLRQDSITSIGSSRGDRDLDASFHGSMKLDELSKASSAPLDTSSRRHSQSKILSSSYGNMLHSSYGQTSASGILDSDADSSVSSNATDKRRRRGRRQSLLHDSSSFINRSFRASKNSPDGMIPRSNTPQGVLLRTRSGDSIASRSSVRSSVRHTPSTRTSGTKEARPGLPDRSKSMDGSAFGRRRSHRQHVSSKSLSSNGTERSRGVARTKSRESFMGGSRIKKWGGSSANKSGHGLSLLEQHLTKGGQQSRRSRRPSISDVKRQNSAADLGSLPSLARQLRS